jgi:hypothetical protein
MAGPTAYLIFSHDNPDQVARLARVLLDESPSCRVVVRHDRERSAPPQVEDDRFHLLDDGIAVAWGSYSRDVESVMAALEWIEGRLDYSSVVLLSGQDYPLRPLAAIEAGFQGDARIGDVWQLRPDWSVLPDAQRDFYLRYFYRHFEWPLPVTAGRIARSLARGGPPRLYVRQFGPGIRPRVGLRRRRTPFDGSLECWVSSEWLTLSRRSVEFLVAFAARRPDVLDHYRRTVSPGESLYATALMNEETFEVEPNHHRFIVFDGPHPRVLTSADLDAITASGKDFGRKFDTRVDAAVLDSLDRVRREA